MSQPKAKKSPDDTKAKFLAADQDHRRNTGKSTPLYNAAEMRFLRNAFSENCHFVILEKYDFGEMRFWKNALLEECAFGRIALLETCDFWNHATFGNMRLLET